MDNLLVTKLIDKDPLVQFHAIREVGNIAGEEAVSLLLDNFGHFSGDNVPIAIEELYNLNYEDDGHFICSALLSCLSHEEDIVRVDAMEMAWLYDCNGEDMVQKVIHLLQTDEEPLVRIQAAETLGELQIVQAIPMLELSLGDPDFLVRCYAADALGRIGEQRSVENLNSRLSIEEDFHVRGYLLIALLRLNALEDQGTLLEAIHANDDVQSREVIINQAIVAISEDDKTLLDQLNRLR